MNRIIKHNATKIAAIAGMIIFMIICISASTKSVFAGDSPATTPVFHHDGVYVLTPDKAGTPPCAVEGDYITIDDINYYYAGSGMFFNADGFADPYYDPGFSAEWINPPSVFEVGKTYTFHYEMYNYNTELWEYTEPIEVTIIAKSSTPTMEYVPINGSKTVSRETIAYLGKLAIPEEEEGDTLTITKDGKSTTYTHDGSEFVNGGFPLDNLVGSTFGREWDENEDFTGNTAIYHLYATINGTKVVSNDITVNLTGEVVNRKEVKSFKFIPAKEYQMVVGDTTTPPDQKNGDKIVVAYDDFSTDIFTFEGGDFYTENGTSLTSVLTDDWETEWLSDQTFNVGDTPKFVYVAGSMTSNAVKVEIIAAPAPVTVSSIRFIHGGEYEMEAVESPSVPLAVSGDLFEVKYSDGTTEYFVYDETQGAFISPSTKQDIESKGTLSAAWNKDQEFKPGTICYFTYALTAGSNTVRTQNISVKFTGTEPTPTPTPAVVSVTVNTKTVNAKALNAAIAKAGVSADSVTTIVLGKKVKKIKKGAFKNFRNAKTLVVKTKKLKKSRVKNSLKGSKINNVKVKVGNKKTNKKYVKKYKKIFKKKNSGRKVKVSL